MKKIIILTTVDDKSLSLFLTERITKNVTIKVCFFSDSDRYISDIFKKNNFDYIYIRDPFTNVRISKDKIIRKINIVLENRKKAYIVDNIENIDDVFFEDKWRQFQIFGNLMPQTSIFEKNNNKNLIYKKRISARTRGVYFDSSKIEKNFSDYIMQERIDIIKEYRVYVIFNKIIKNVGIKTSKTENSGVRLFCCEQTPKDVIDFSKKVCKELKFDFIGIDVAKAVNGKYYLIEVNRSCSFLPFYTLTGENLAEKFINNLLLKK